MFNLLKGLRTVFVVPILTVLAVGLGVSSLIAFVCGLLLAFQVEGMKMEILPEVFLAPWMSLIISFLFAVLLFYLSKRCFHLLHK